MTDNYINIIQKAIAKLKRLTQLDIQGNWYEFQCFDLEQDLTEIDFNQGSKVQLNEKRYWIFPQGRKVRWLIQKITTPYCLNQYPLSGLILRLVLTWWAEDAQIFINGKLVQQGDLFDSSARVVVTNAVIPQQEFLIAIRLVSPNHDIGALMRSHLVYEADSKFELVLDPGFIADELDILTQYLSKFESGKLALLATEINKIDWNILTSAATSLNFLNSVRQKLLPLVKDIKKRKFNLLGHAHLDMAWLWTTAETYQVAQRTFKSVLSLQQNYPQLTFGHTSPALYQWIEENCPDLFLSIQDAVKEGKWETLGGMWIEPEVNIISGESIIRQLLYGQKYFAEKFGNMTRVAWLPDSFGFPWQLPQILKLCGIDYFVTGKLHWNDTTKFPHGCFWWESPDGTRLFTLMSPPNVTGVMDTNPITMMSYGVEWESQTGLQDIFWLPGVGDHGGGPTRDMLDVAEKWQQSPFFPQIEFTTATRYLDRISHQHSSFPLHASELYLELHRGCYTTHGEQKRFNRYCENLLYQAELFATIATIIKKNRLRGIVFPHYTNNTMEESPSQEVSVNNNLDFKNSSQQLLQQTICWQQQIETAWKKVLFNQFHDILPGTSIPEVFTEANQKWEAAINIGEKILADALKAIASWIKLPNPPAKNAQAIIIFNPLNWLRSTLISIPTDSKSYGIYDGETNSLVNYQTTKDNQLLFLAENIPSIGYRVYWLCKLERENSFNLQQEKLSQDFILENKYLKVTVNRSTGDLDSIYDLVNQKEILSGAGNQLQAFTDQGQYWDAWNIDPEYQQKLLPSAKLTSIQWLNRGDLQQSIRVKRIIGQSEFIQDYILEKNSPILNISTTVDWQETHVLVKSAFPLTIESDYATYEIACGAIKRSTKPQTIVEQAKWEVSALKWVDLTDEKQNYGVSLLNDCKYGYDVQPNQIRITLLRSSVWPNPQADRGKHKFAYGIYPHLNSWQTAQTVQKSYEFNIPLQVVTMPEKPIKYISTQEVPKNCKLLDLSADNLILMSLKFSEKNNKSGNNIFNSLILRCYESQGKTAILSLQGDLRLTILEEVNCLEQDVKSQQGANTIVLPWQIKTFKLRE